MDSMHPTHIQGFPPAAGLHVPAWVPPCPTCMAMCPLALITSMPTCTFSHGCPLDPPTWMHSPSPSLHLCPPPFPHTDMSCPPHGFPPPHHHHTFCPHILHGCPSSHPHGHMPTHMDTCPLTQTHAHSHRHMPTHTDTCPLTQTHAHSHRHMPTHPLAQTHAHWPTCMDTCPLALIAFIKSTPTCMSPHRYVSSPCMDAHPLMLVSPAACLHAPPWVPPHQPCTPLCSLHPCPPACPCTDMSHPPTQRPAPS